MDVTGGRQWYIDINKTVATYNEYKYKFEWVDALAGNPNTTYITEDDFNQYDAAGNKIQSIDSKIIRDGYKKADGVIFTDIILDMVQQGSQTYNLIITLNEGASGRCFADARFFISFPPKNGSDISFTQKWNLGINENGDWFFLNAWNMILDMEAGEVRER